MSDQKQTKHLDRDILEQEVVVFVKEKGYTPEFLRKYPEVFQANLIEYLQSKGYLLVDILKEIKKYEQNEEERDEKKRPPLPKKITKLSEKLNKCDHPFKIFEDTTTLIPGMVIYTLEKIEPNTKKPYTMYRPTPRVITQIHDSGVNGGTVFLTYEHKYVNPDQFSSGKIQVVAQDEVLYSPLTYGHARYICRLLNAQSKNLYNEKIKELKQKQLQLKKESNQHTK